MLLFVRGGCSFCKGLPTRKDLQVFEVSGPTGAPTITLGDSQIPLPPEIWALPALKDGNTVIMGPAPILEHLEKHPEA